MKDLINSFISILFFTTFSLQASASIVTHSSFTFFDTAPVITYQITVNKKTIISASLIVVNVGDVAPKGYEITSTEIISKKGSPLSFDFTKPDKDWPTGDYEIVIKDNDTVIHRDSLVILASDDATSASSPQQSPKHSSNNSGVLAQGQGGQLTETAANAYVDALTFILDQLGQQQSFTPQQRQTIINNLATHYTSFPVDTQQELAAAQQIFDEYKRSWNYLGIDEQKEFAYGVLTVAYGEQAAAQALGINESRGGNNSANSYGGGSSYYSDGASYASDGECAIFSSEYGSISSCD